MHYHSLFSYLLYSLSRLPLPYFFIYFVHFPDCGNAEINSLYFRSNPKVVWKSSLKIVKDKTVSQFSLPLREVSTRIIADGFVIVGRQWPDTGSCPVIQGQHSLFPSLVFKSRSTVYLYILTPVTLQPLILHGQLTIHRQGWEREKEKGEGWRDGGLRLEKAGKDYKQVRNLLLQVCVRERGRRWTVLVSKPWQVY